MFTAAYNNFRTFSKVALVNYVYLYKAWQSNIHTVRETNIVVRYSTRIPNLNGDRALDSSFELSVYIAIVVQAFICFNQVKTCKVYRAGIKKD